MQFHEYETLHAGTLRVAREEYGHKESARLVGDLASFTSKMLAKPEPTVGAKARLELEQAWYDLGSPYYRVYPDYAAMFAETEIDVLSDYLRMPYFVFGVLFAKGHELVLAGMRLRSFLIARCRSEGSSLGSTELLIILQTNDSNDEISTLFASHGIVPGQTLRDSINASHVEHVAHGYPSPAVEVDSAVLAIALSVCFLATGGDKLVEPDVLNKDFDAYLRAVNTRSVSEVSSLHAKATKTRGRIGYSVGRSESLLGRRAYDVDTTTNTDNQGRELKWRQKRKAHFHTYRTGPGRQNREVKFIRMLIIRPDLPVRPEPLRVKARTPVDRFEESAMLAAGSPSHDAGTSVSGTPETGAQDEFLKQEQMEV